MGRQIVYCGRCGSGIRHDEFERGRAVMVEMIAYCRGCVPADTPLQLPAQTPRELPTATPRRGQAVVRTESSARLSPGTSRRVRPGVGMGPWLAGAAAAVVLLGGFAFFGSGSRPSEPSGAATEPAVRRVRPVEAPRVEPAGPSPVLVELLAFEKSGADPDAVLLRCDQARPLLKGTPGEKTLGEIEQRAGAEKARRDRERQFETALRSAMELIASEHAAEREKEVLALLAAAAEIAGPRKAEISALEARYREILKRAAQSPAPATAPPVSDAPPVQALPAPVPGLLPDVTPSPGVLLFQNGRFPGPDYAGTADATLNENDPEKAMGKSGELEADGDEPQKTDKDRSFLLRWDLSSVAPGTRIASAEVYLKVHGPSRSGYAVYALSRPWTEAETTWSRASAGMPWETPGARGPGDRRAEPVARIPGASGILRLVLDPALVQEWIDRPSSNAGLQVDGPKTGDGLLVRSREWKVAAERPLLRLVQAVGSERILFQAGISDGFAKLEGGTATPEGLLVPPAGVVTRWKAFSTPIGPRTRMRFRLKALADVDMAYAQSWCQARKKNAWHILRRLRKDAWLDVDVAVGDFRFGFDLSDPRFEGELFEGFRIYFDGPPDVRLLLERVEVVEAGAP